MRLLIASLLLLSITTSAPATEAPRQLIITIAPGGDLPGTEQPAAIGVYPASRSIADFYREVSAGRPTGDVSGTRGIPGSLALALNAAGVRISAYGALASIAVYGNKTRSEPAFDEPDLARAGLIIASPPRLPARSDITLASLGATTPILVGSTSDETWKGSVAERSGIVTPYDISTFILKHFDVDVPPSFLSSGVRSGAKVDVRSLAKRLRRDAGFQQSLTAWTVGVGLGFGFLAALGLAWRRKSALAQRVAVAASTASAGYLAGLFVPSARGDVRAIGVLALFIAVLILNPKSKQRFAATTFAALGGATALVAVASAFRPDVEPALGFWGNPLISWRFRGLLNYQAAFIAGGVVAGATALGAGVPVLGASLAAAIVLTAAPVAGSNFVGVLTLSFGGALAVQAVKAKTIRRNHFVIAALFATAAFGAALAFDAAFGSSHGGRAAQGIASGGIGNLIDVTLDRLRLNGKAILALPGGVVWALAFAGLFVTMIRWGMKDTLQPMATRAAVAACASSGLAALLLEDSGFKTSAVMGFPALILWTLARLDRRHAL